jgi:Mn2+/Fe2+ NRAMP family transporter
MKHVLMFYFLLLAFVSQAQTDSIGRAIEPDQETSFENYELLIIAILGLLLLVGLRFWFKRTRKR